jgi:GT2 family glycosyltransferase
MGSFLHILIPAYGRPDLLRHTLNSVAAFPAANVRVTVVDDASPDGEIKELVAGYEAIGYVRNDRNLGISANFNHCASLSTGEYTVLLGSDDLLLPGYPGVIRGLVEEFDRPAMAMPSVTVIDEVGLPARPLADRVKSWVSPRGEGQRLLIGESFASSLLRGNWLYFPAIAWQTDLLRQHGFRTDQHTAMDLDLELRLVFAGEGLGWSSEVAARYRRHTASASSTEAAAGRRFEEERELARWAATEAASRGWTSAARTARARPLSRLHAASVAASATLTSPRSAGPLWSHVWGR